MRGVVDCWTYAMVRLAMASTTRNLSCMVGKVKVSLGKVCFL